MKFLTKIFFLLFFSSPFIAITSCVDKGIEEIYEHGPLPEEFKEGFSLSLQISLDPMGGAEFRTRASDSETRDIEDFIDLERLRILFFTCDDEQADATYTEAGKQYDSGKHDVFLFESKSRWVSEVESSSANAAKVWQVTTPVFTYGNEDKYDWDRIREALTTKPFKIAILANRPGTMRFGDFDKAVQGGGEFFFGNGGPYWGPNESFNPNYTINDLHHCQWDPVYTSKNLIKGVSSNTSTDANGNSVYNFIMKNPKQSTDSIDGKTQNLMGAVSQWTKKGTDGNNYYFHPDRSQGIPMYGVQKFDKITNWIHGTPFNISESQKGQDNTYYGKTISLLRSLVRIELMIPKVLGGKNVIVEDVTLEGSNVMARCEPLDVATPTNLLWSTDNCSGEGTDPCEWFAVQKKLAIINEDNMGQAAKGDNVAANDLLQVKKTFVNRIAWYYGAWQKWWDFNDPDVSGWKPDFGSAPYPHIYNPVTQRNSTVFLDNCTVTDDAFYHYVVYTGERNIIDPTNFRDLRLSESKICYFKFSIRYQGGSSTSGKNYQVAIADYSNKNSLIQGYLNSGTDFGSKTGYLVTMAKSTNPDELNWVLLRNHVYRFQITGIAGNLDEGGFDGLVISTEERAAPDITYE